MQGGILKSYISSLVSFLEGDLWRGGGGDPGPGGNFLCLCWAGRRGSTCTVSIRTILSLLLSPVYPFEANLTTSDYPFPSFWTLVPKAAAFFIPKISSILSLALLMVF